MSRARITISKAGMSLLQAAQFPVVPKSLPREWCRGFRGLKGRGTASAQVSTPLHLAGGLRHGEGAQTAASRFCEEIRHSHPASREGSVRARGWLG